MAELDLCFIDDHEPIRYDSYRLRQNLGVFAAICQDYLVLPSCCPNNGSCVHVASKELAFKMLPVHPEHVLCVAQCSLNFHIRIVGRRQSDLLAQTAHHVLNATRQALGEVTNVFMLLVLRCAICYILEDVELCFLKPASVSRLRAAVLF